MLFLLSCKGYKIVNNYDNFYEHQVKLKVNLETLIFFQNLTLLQHILIKFIYY